MSCKPERDDLSQAFIERQVSGWPNSMYTRAIPEPDFSLCFSFLGPVQIVYETGTFFPQSNSHIRCGGRKRAGWAMAALAVCISMHNYNFPQANLESAASLSDW